MPNQSIPPRSPVPKKGDFLVRRQLQLAGFAVYSTPQGKKHGHDGWAEKSSPDPRILNEFSRGDGTMAHMGLSNMFCIDPDRHGNGIDGVANLRRFLKDHGLRLPKTLTHLTPRGGLHTFYRQNPECHVPTSHGRLAPGVDILADRTLAMMPPTPGYRTRDDHPIAVAPIELARCIAELTPAAAPKGRTDAVGGVVKHSISGVMQTLCNAPEGQRNSTLYWALNRVAEMPAGKHQRLIRQISREASHLGLPDWEINQTIDSVFGGQRG